MLNLEAAPDDPPPRETASSPHRIRSGRGHILIDKVSIAFETRGAVSLAVKETSIEIQPGEFACILGPSGSGKSTLLNSVAGYIRPRSGEIKVDGKLVTGPGPDRGMVFQQYSLFPWKTVRENVAFGPRMLGHANPEGVADAFIEMVGLSKVSRRYPKELSGGMQQRVGIARALANNPSVLLMDEPFGALDSQTRHMMQGSLLQIWSEFGTTVIFVTHDIDEAVFLGDRVLIMSASPGRIIAEIGVDLPRPRDPGITVDDRFLKLRQRCHDCIRAESSEGLRAAEQPMTDRTLHTRAIVRMAKGGQPRAAQAVGALECKSIGGSTAMRRRARQCSDGGLHGIETIQPRRRRSGCRPSHTSRPDDGASRRKVVEGCGGGMIALVAASSWPRAVAAKVSGRLLTMIENTHFFYRVVIGKWRKAANGADVGTGFFSLAGLRTANLKADPRNAMHPVDRT